MSKIFIIGSIGIWVAVLPFLGFPNVWERWIFLVSGVGVAVLAFIISKKSPSPVSGIHASDAYAQSSLSGHKEEVYEKTDGESKEK